MFIGRNLEIEKLNSFYEGNNCGVAAITGSIGMGKSTLLRHFSDQKKTYFFTAYETTGKHQIQMIANQFGLEKEDVSAKDLCETISRVASSEKILLIIDQYPNLVKADVEFDRILQSYVINQWKNLPVKVILCGDAFVLMEKYVLGKKAGWSQLLTLNLEVGALDFYDSYQFFPEADMVTAAYLYGITGGIPYNLAKVTGDIKADTINLFLSKDACGINPEQVMATELRELSYYNYMLATLAKGLNRVNQISAEVEKPKDVVVPYLNSLMAIGVVTKDTAITELNNRKKTRYSIVNTSTYFWYKFVVPNMHILDAGQTEKLWNVIEEGLSEYMQQVFIRICAEYLKKAGENGDTPFSVEETGNWWVNDEEAGTTDGFDLVALGKCDGKSATVFGQCYYTDEQIDVAKLKLLIEKTKQLHRVGETFYLVFSKSGFNENARTISSAIKNIMLITLDDMKY